MQVQRQAMGPYQTNCYIITVQGKDFIIDPGVDATQWVTTNVTNPIAILNTHGHFDHVWSNQAVKEQLNIPIYCPKEDIARQSAVTSEICGGFVKHSKLLFFVCVCVCPRYEVVLASNDLKKIKKIFLLRNGVTSAFSATSPPENRYVIQL